jgi:tripartite-type tricarboxylate transporter receptor subunit TctC
MIRRALLTLLAALALAAHAQEYPSKPIKLIVPFPPGGGTDVLSRATAHALATANGWNVIVDNRPGAGGNIGLDATAKSPPDGYTIAMGQTANLAVNPALYRSIPFDPLRDFAPIALVSSQPLVLVVAAQSPYRTLNDILAAAKAKPGELNMGSAGNGTIGHIGGELFQRRAGVKFTHVPYKGAAAAVTDMLGGRVDVFFANTQSVSGQITGGKLRTIAVTSAKRLETMPDVPTIAELGFAGFEAATWSGLVAPAGTPQPIIDRLNAEVNKALQTKDLQQKLRDDASTALGGTPKQFTEFLRAEIAKWGAAVRDAGIKLD